VLESLLAGRSRHHLARLDRVPAARAQLRTLLGLVHHARATPFGRDHDFARIRTAADFRRLVPVRGPAELARGYGQPGQAWPAESAPLVAPHPALGRPPRRVALTGGLIRAHRRALRTALALVLAARPRARLLDGRLLWLGDDTVPAGPAGQHRRLEEMALGRFPFSLRFAVRAAAGLDCLDRRRLDGCVPALADRLAGESPSCIVGPGERIAAFCRHVRDSRGEDLGRLWPGLTAVLFTRRDPAFSPEALRGLLGPHILLVEVLSRPEAPLAVHDPRLGGMRLLVEHGVYFEFVPLERAGDFHPPRLGLDEVRPGVPYEVALTSPAGLWAQKSGLVVAFDRVAPPVVRLLPEEARAAAPLRSDGAAASAPRASHRQSGGTPAALPETPYRSPWSAPADRG
jgi:hypothetical protein